MNKIFIRYILKIVLLTFLFYSLSIQAHSKNQIIIRDTIIPRGQTYSIPVYGTIDTDSLKSIKTGFFFNFNILDLKEIQGGNGYGIGCSQIRDFKISTPGLDGYVRLEFSCDTVNKISNGIICYLKFEGIAGNDTVSNLIPDSIIINGKIDSSATLTKGIIKVPGIPIIQRFIDDIGECYPNPFSDIIDFPFTIGDTTDIKINFYSLTGATLQNQSDIAGMLTLYRITDSTKVPVNLMGKIIKGKYILELTQEQERFSSGIYYFVFKTKNGIFSKSFIYNR